ncbi:MAG: hypothetical protein ACOCQX_04515 [Candidatus Nanoarchaeia archaeon]
MYEFLVVIVAFSGLIAGYLLSLIAPEELRPGQYYFEMIRYVSLILFILLVGSSLTESPIISASVVLLFFALLYFTGYIGLFYLLSAGLIIFLVQPYILAGGILLFLCGMASASVLAVKYEKNEKIKNKTELLLHTFKVYGWFLIIGLLPFLFSNL